MLRHGQYISAENNESHTVTVTGQCVITGKTHSIVVPELGLRRWASGQLAQVAMPTVSKEDREFLISGTTPEGWERLFPTEVRCTHCEIIGTKAAIGVSCPCGHGLFALCK